MKNIKNKTKLLILLFNILVVTNGSTQAFITTWKTDNTSSGSSNSTSITIPTAGGGYNYDVDWNNDGTFDEFGITGNITHDFGTAGTYTIRIQGDFPRIYFNFSGDRLKIININEWGNIVWSNMYKSFYGAQNMNSNAVDSPDLSNVINMSQMFYYATSFNGDVSNWDVSNVTNMSRMFDEAYAFNGDVSNWDVSSVTNMSYLFNNSSFAGDVSNWDVSNVTTMRQMFSKLNDFNGDVSNWDVSSVINMWAMFYYATSFNGDISNWDVSNATNLRNIFTKSDFNGDVSNWDVSNVTTMNSMFSYCPFNGDISNWDVSNVSDMNSMFDTNSFNGDISGWNVGNVTIMVQMFNNSSFAGDVSNWDVSNVSDMKYMFSNATSFNQNLDSWDISAQPDMIDMLKNSGLSVDNYDNTLIGWESQGVSGLNLGANGVKYCHSYDERNSLINTYGWSISGDIHDCTIPIELVYLYAKQEKKIINLSWQTASETNNQGFNIQKSRDGNNWQTIGFVQGKGTTRDIHEYSYTDTNPFIGINYYRLKQIDFDGGFEYSDVVSVVYQNGDKSSFHFYPNPTDGIIHFRSEKQGIIRIIDQIGNTIYNDVPNDNTIDISGYPNGIYTLLYEVDGRLESYKVVVMGY